MILKRDLLNFFKFTYWIAILMISYIVDFLIMANTLGNIIVGIDYLRFFGPGITLVAAYSASFILARKINIEKENKFDHYLLSLPIKRFDFILGRAIAGAIQGLIYSFPLLIINFILIQVQNLYEIILIIIFIFIFSLSMTCLAMIIATTFRGARNFSLARSIVYLWLLFGSTIFYPINLISKYFESTTIILLNINPMSFAVNIFRGILFKSGVNIFDIIGLGIFMVSIIFFGIYSYERSVNKG